MPLAATSYSDPFASPHHKLARLATRNGKRFAAGLASPSWWREAFAPKVTEPVALPALTEAEVRSMVMRGFTFSVDADRNELIVQRPFKVDRVYSLDLVPLSAFASFASALSAIEE